MTIWIVRSITHFLIALTLLVLTSSSGSAQTATSSNSSDPTMAICTALLAQSAAPVSGNKTKLCNCLMRETTSKLSTEDMMAYSEASLNSQTPPTEVLAKVMSIATTCLQEAR